MSSQPLAGKAPPDAHDAASRRGPRTGASVVAPRPLVRVEDALSHAHGVRRHFHELVTVDELERGFDRGALRRREDDVLIAAGGADVRELFLPRHIDVEVLWAVVLADDHALVDLGA